MFLAVSKLVLTDNTLTSKEFEGLRTIALYLEISERLWNKIVKEIQKDVKFFEE